MKILFYILIGVSLCFAALDIPEHLKKPLAIARKGCLELSSVDEKYVNQTKNGYVPNVPELGCYMNCMFDHVGMKTEDGSIVWDKVVHLLPPTFQESAFFVSKECGTIRGDDECETALLTVTCFFTKAPEGSEFP